MEPVDTVAVCRTSHRRLLAALVPLTDDDCRAPSLLPGFTRGHLLTHLANKAKAHVAICGGPAAGEVRRLHPEGYDADLAAAAGAARSAEDLRVDLAGAFALLEATWAALDQAHWQQHGIMQAGPRTLAEIVAHHLRNVEVHHVDLDIGYLPADWPVAFLEGELARRLRALPDRAEHAELLAWLLDRAPAPALRPW